MKSKAYIDTTFVFYLITVTLLTALSYLIIYDDIEQTRRQKSIDLYKDISSHVKEGVVTNPQNLEHILTNHLDGDVSYQIMLILPSGRPHIHQYNRADQRDLKFFILPYWQDDDKRFDYQVQSDQLLGHLNIGQNTRLYVQAFHPPRQMDITRFIYWLPLLTALVLICIALLLVHRHRLDWQILMDYMNNFSKRLYEPYSPVRFKDILLGQEFLRLGTALNRIHYQLYHSHRRIQLLQTRIDYLVEQAPLPIFLINRNGQISFFNKRFEKVFMTSFEESITYYLSDFLMGIDKETQVALANLDSERRSRVINVISLGQQGTPYQLHLSPWFSKQGQVQGYCAMLSDISIFTHTITTARNKLTQQQEKLNEFDKLWSVLGHELRTPLNGILGMLELMDQDNFTVDQQETFVTLQQTSKDMLTMLNDMLDVAKMDAGKLQVINERTDLLELSKQVLDLMASSARQQNIELLSRCDPQCPRYFTTDAGRLRQALMNLLSNAIKFTQTGYVALSVYQHETEHPFIQTALKGSDNLTLSTHVDNWICFTIQDTGIGITQREKQKLFSHFNQANESISRQFGGTGLGLAISNNFAKLLGGFIHVDSELGVGSTFSLCLPANEVSYQPIYQFNTDLSDLYLIAFTSQDISTKALIELSNYLKLAATVHTGIEQAHIDKINNQYTTGLNPIILVEYELYTSANIDLLNKLHVLDVAPKILLSMTPKNAIFDSILEQYDAFLNKPLDVAQLVTELVRQKNYEGSDKPSMSRSSKYGASKVQQSFNDFMHSLQETDNQSSSQQTSLPRSAPFENNTIEPTQAIGSENPLILVAEDNKINQKVVSKLLQRLGYSCIIAQNGQEALEYLDTRQEEIALVLMDCRMPIVDGLEATKLIRAKKNTIPIIALTANDTDSDREQCLQVGMNGFLAKPIKEKSLDKMLKKFITS